MTTVAGRFIIAVLLFAAGAACWAEAKVARRVADAYRRFATLHYDTDDRIGDARSVLDRMPLPIETIGAEVQRHRTTVSYWRGEYGALTAPVDAADLSAADPMLMFARANAAFRTSMGRLGETAILERLDGIINAYGDVLRTDPATAEASYNYEYVVRFRDKLAKMRPRDRATRAATKIQDEIPSVDLPSGPTIYGRQGGPPPDLPGSQFKTLAPMPYDEREETDPGRGVAPRRRG